MNENWLEVMWNELVAIRGEIEEVNKDAMPWRLQIAAQLMAHMGPEFGMNMSVKMALVAADALIKAHEETK